MIRHKMPSFLNMKFETNVNKKRKFANCDEAQILNFLTVI